MIAYIPRAVRMSFAASLDTALKVSMRFSKSNSTPRERQHARIVTQSDMKSSCASENCRVFPSLFDGLLD